MVINPQRMFNLSNDPHEMAAASFLIFTFMTKYMFNEGNIENIVQMQD
jgi:hypothetical protein